MAELGDILMWRKYNRREALRLKGSAEEKNYKQEGFEAFMGNSQTKRPSLWSVCEYASFSSAETTLEKFDVK